MKKIVISLILLAVVIGTYFVFGKNKENKEIEGVVDNISPKITLKGQENETVYIGDKYTELGYVAEDNTDGDISDKVQIDGEIDITTEGDYILTYKVQDSFGNIGEAKRNITVKQKVTSVDKTVRGLPILMYHFFYDTNSGETGPDSNWMEISAFDEQMKYLSENEYYYPSWNEVYEFVVGGKELPEKSVVISIDDGDPSFFSLAVPVLKKYNVTATSFIVTSWYGPQVAAYKSSILNFESHTHDMHKPGSDGKGAFLTKTYEEGLLDINTSKDICGSGIAFCYPFGHYNDNAIKVLKDAEYKVAVTTVGGRAYPGMDQYLLPRVRMSKGDSLSAFISKVK